MKDFTKQAKARAFAAFLLILAASCALTSCFFGESSEIGHFWDEIGCSWAVPGMMASSLLDVEAQIVETDDFGRTLMEYSGFSDASQQKETAMVILQKHDEKNIYFYEDICYIIGEYTDEELEKLKTDNDWGQHLNEEKLSVRLMRKYNGRPTMINPSKRDWSEVESICERAIKRVIPLNFPNSISHPQYVDGDSLGNEIYSFHIDVDEVRKVYFAFIEPDDTVYLMEITDPYDFAEEYAQFKKDHGWQYGVGMDS